MNFFSLFLRNLFAPASRKVKAMVDQGLDHVAAAYVNAKSEQRDLRVLQAMASVSATWSTPFEEAEAIAFSRIGQAPTKHVTFVDDSGSIQVGIPSSVIVFGDPLVIKVDNARSQARDLEHSLTDGHAISRIGFVVAVATFGSVFRRAGGWYAEGWTGHGANNMTELGTLMALNTGSDTADLGAGEVGTDIDFIGYLMANYRHQSGEEITPIANTARVQMLWPEPGILQFSQRDRVVTVKWEPK